MGMEVYTFGFSVFTLISLFCFWRELSLRLDVIEKLLKNKRKLDKDKK